MKWIFTSVGLIRAKGTWSVGDRSIWRFHTRGIHALEQIGIADEALQNAIPMRGRMIHHKSGALHFAPYDVDPKKCINSIGRAALNATVIEAAQRYSNVRVHFNHKCTGVDIDSAVAQSGHAKRAASRHAAMPLLESMARSPQYAKSMQNAIANFSIRRELSRSRLQGIDHSAWTGWLMANGEKRPAHLATKKFHDDCPS